MFLCVFLNFRIISPIFVEEPSTRQNLGNSRVLFHSNYHSFRAHLQIKARGYLRWMFQIIDSFDSSLMILRASKLSALQILKAEFVSVCPVITCLVSHASEQISPSSIDPGKNLQQGFHTNCYCCRIRTYFSTIKDPLATRFNTLRLPAKLVTKIRFPLILTPEISLKLIQLILKIL